ncbi:hypothetical protein NP493_249g04027 [Ridgeia piscesae]|uniref:Uncharacterized protein n=1 Tax=Ridgeia piscesae TaxID=27915 RepID=A0AAD9NYK9_RIDPI|nr:hypothetical protein NP493_249g04027 [Ridgeia piscesae]
MYVLMFSNNKTPNVYLLKPTLGQKQFRTLQDSSCYCKRKRLWVPIVKGNLFAKIHLCQIRTIIMVTWILNGTHDLVTSANCAAINKSKPSEILYLTKPTTNGTRCWFNEVFTSPTDIL